MTSSRKVIFFKDKPQYEVQFQTCVIWFRRCEIIDEHQARSATVVHRSDGPAIIRKNGPVSWVWADENIGVVAWLEKVREAEDVIDDETLALLYLKYL